MQLDDRVRLRHLTAAVAIADNGTMIRAAEHLYTSQPAVSRTLRDLEAIVGVELFVRSARGMTPTVFGHVFLSHARAALGHLTRAQTHIRELVNAEAGKVTVGTHLAGSNSLLPWAVAALKSQHPHVTVAVREATPDILHADLVAGDIDLIVGRLTPSIKPERVEQSRLYEEPVRLVAKSDHPAHQIESPTLADLLDFPWILPVERTTLRGELEQVFRSHQLPMPANLVESTSVLTVRTLLLESDFIAALPMLILRLDPDVQPLSTSLEGIAREVGVTMATEFPLSPSAALLLDYLKATAETMASELHP